MDKKLQILDASQVEMKLKRIAYEIVENNIGKKEIVLAGIRDNGVVLAGLLKGHIETISDIRVRVIVILINKQNPIECQVEEDFDPKGKDIIVVDDVADSGRTAMYALKPFLKDLPEKIQLAVLVDRKHKKFPVTADYVGIQLSTNLHDIIRVTIAKNLSITAYIE